MSCSRRVHHIVHNHDHRLQFSVSSIIYLRFTYKHYSYVIFNVVVRLALKNGAGIVIIRFFFPSKMQSVDFFVLGSFRTRLHSVQQNFV